MNSKMIRKIIKEELQSLLLTEKFQSKKLTALYSLLASERWNGGKRIFDRMADKKQFDWANTPDSAVTKATSGDSNSNVLNVFIVTKSKKNTRDKSWYGGTVSPGLLGLTLGKSVLGMNGNIVSRRGDRAGANYNTKGIHNFKAFGEYADIVYRIDTSNIPSSAELQSDRRKAKDGATALMGAREVLRKNRQRYQDALKQKAGEGGWKSAREMVKRATEAFQKAIENHTKLLSSGMYMDTWQNEYSNASNLYSEIMDKFKRFQEQNKSAMKYKDDPRDSGYHKDRMAGTLKEMQDAFKNFARKMKQLEGAKPIKIKSGW